MSEEIKKINIEDEMKSSYINYAMSVIVSRALPDVRDGLKPVHRRILYTMHEMKLSHNKPFKKSARIVGDVMGKYHPHGDAAIYNSLVRMAQDFSLRYPLVDGQGNFGSIDGDSAAAMRYSEARMQKIAAELLQDIEKETVDFSPNYDNSLDEPTVLPTIIPNLLINGTEGIAVAMSTKIPPHNLKDVLKALIFMIDKPEATVEELSDIVKAPDFPTGGYIYGLSGIKEAYKTGSGRVDIRAKAEIETSAKGRDYIIVTEIPYQVVKSDLVKDIAELVKDKRIEDIDDIRDESGRNGLRIVIKVKKSGNAKVLLNQLYKMTKLQIPYHMLFIALDHGVPKLMNLHQILRAFLDHRRDIVTRRTLFDLRKAQEKMHILMGYKVALANIDEVVEIIRKASNRQDAKISLISRFELSDIQADAVLELRLHRLTSMEVDKIIQDIADLQIQIDYYQKLLSDSVELMGVIRSEFERIISVYGDGRKSEIIPVEGDISLEDTIANEETIITISKENYIKRIAASVYNKQKRGGKGKMAMTTKEEDVVDQVITALAHDHLLFFTNFGKVYRLKVYELPEASRIGKGRPIINLLPLEANEVVETIMPIQEFSENKFIVMMTNTGTIKKTSLSEFESIRVTGKIAITLEDNESLINCAISDGSNEIFIVSKFGKSIRFHEEQVRAMGRTAHGVTGIRLEKNDTVVGMMIVNPESEVFVVSEFGYGKKTSLEEYRSQNRGGRGVNTMNITRKTGDLLAVLQLMKDDHLVVVTNTGKLIRMDLSALNSIGRVTQGVRLIQLDDNEAVASVSKLTTVEDEEIQQVGEDSIIEHQIESENGESQENTPVEEITESQNSEN
ncbi:DNA gyrase subunit A [bacterium]|nr:DNA gyrase subunit A [bacterium]